MAPKHATRDALLTYLRADTQPRHIRRIERYMRMMHGVNPPATREALRRQARLGAVAQIEPGYWGIAPAPTR